jgi:nitrogenase molybdenum-iron protein alpha/beta subunit
MKERIDRSMCKYDLPFGLEKGNEEGGSEVAKFFSPIFILTTCIRPITA